MPLLAVALLAVGVAAALTGGHAAVRGGVPLVAAGVALVSGAVSTDEAAEVVGHLVTPLAFVVAAVLLAEALADAGVFTALARRVPRRRRALGLWGLAAVTVALLNLDAAVVLLTPLYVAIATEAGEEPLALAAQPALVACLASSLLPVSNLTNLIAVEAGRADLGLFLGSLALPTLVAVAVGYAGWRVRFHRHRPGPGDVTEPPAGRADGGATRLGLLTFAALVVGFVPLAAAGVPHWIVAAVVLTVVCVARRSPPAWARIPAAVLAATVGLAVLAAALATQVDVTRWLGTGEGAGDELRIVAVGALGANVLNNLPALVVGLPAVEGDRGVAALLLGVNLGPLFVVTGAVSGLLWLDATRRAGLRTSAGTYLSVGVVAVPAIIAATCTFLLV